MKDQTKTELPGYKRNALGHLVPIETIAQMDIEQDSLVDELFKKAKALQADMIRFKFATLGDIQAFVDLVAERYQVAKRSEEGFVTLTSFDGQRKIKISIGKNMTFGVELSAARELVHGCIRKWAAGSNTNIRALVEHAFRTDEEGKLSPSRIWELTRIEITDDEDWTQAMKAIRDAVRWEGEKPYLRFYERQGKDKKWEMLSLDMASLAQAA